MNGKHFTKLYMQFTKPGRFPNGCSFRSSTRDCPGLPVAFLTTGSRQLQLPHRAALSIHYCHRVSLPPPPSLFYLEATGTPAIPLPELQPSLREEGEEQEFGSKRA